MRALYESTVRWPSGMLSDVSSESPSKPPPELPIELPEAEAAAPQFDSPNPARLNPAQLNRPDRNPAQARLNPLAVSVSHIRDEVYDPQDDVLKATSMEARKLAPPPSPFSSPQHLTQKLPHIPGRMLLPPKP